MKFLPQGGDISSKGERRKEGRAKEIRWDAHCYHGRRRLEIFFLAAAVPAISSRKCIPTLGHKRMRRRNFNPSRYNFHVKWREFPANVWERIWAIRRTTSVASSGCSLWVMASGSGGINLWKGKK